MISTRKSEISSDLNTEKGLVCEISSDLNTEKGRIFRAAPTSDQPSLGVVVVTVQKGGVILSCECMGLWVEVDGWRWMAGPSPSRVQGYSYTKGYGRGTAGTDGVQAPAGPPPTPDPPGGGPL